jgi:hypothetical protein
VRDHVALLAVLKSSQKPQPGSNCG